MNTKRGLESQDRNRSPQFRTITAIFIILFTVACYFLMRSMVQHRFSGGERDYSQSEH